MESHYSQSKVDAPFAPPKIQAEQRAVLWGEAEQVSMESWGKALGTYFHTPESCDIDAFSMRKPMYK